MPRSLLQQTAASPTKLRSIQRWEDVPIQLLEEMLLVCAEMVDRRGVTAHPLLEKLESEYIKAKRRTSQVERIKRLIASD